MPSRETGKEEVIHNIQEEYLEILRKNDNTYNEDEWYDFL